MSLGAAVGIMCGWVGEVDKRDGIHMLGAERRRVKPSKCTRVPPEQASGKDYEEELNVSQKLLTLSSVNSATYK